MYVEPYLSLRQGDAYKILDYIFYVTCFSVYYPDDEGEYSVVYFVSGLSGVVPPSAYDVVLKKIASHGFIVFTPWALNSDDESDEMFNNLLDWVSFRVLFSCNPEDV